MTDLTTRVQEFAISQRHEAARLRERAADTDARADEKLRTARELAAKFGPAAMARTAPREFIRSIRDEAESLAAASLQCETRARVAERDPPGVLTRPEVEYRNPDFMNRWRTLIADASRAGWVLTELPGDMR